MVLAGGVALPVSGAALVWLIIALFALLGLVVVVYWVRSARETLDQMHHVLSPRGQQIDDEDESESA